MNICFTFLTFCLVLQSSLSSVIQHCNLVDSCFSISIVLNVPKWRVPFKTDPAERPPSLIESNTSASRLPFNCAFKESDCRMAYEPMKMI